MFARVRRLSPAGKRRAGQWHAGRSDRRLGLTRKGRYGCVEDARREEDDVDSDICFRLVRPPGMVDTPPDRLC